MPSLRRTFFVNALAGLLMWVFSRPLTGHYEPWDGGLAIYLGLLFAVGFITAALWKGHPRDAYWGAFAGQCAFGLYNMLTGNGNLLALGIIILLFMTLPAFVGAYLARKLAK